MKFKNIIIAFLLTLAFTGCDKPIPAERSAFVGEWQAKTMYLLIREDGSVSYKRIDGGSTKIINAPLKSLSADSFAVGVGLMSTTFKVTKPPYQDDGHWKMVVDGVELVKSEESRSLIPPQDKPAGLEI